ncbi:hypothetical protein KW5_0104060 [Xanthomonas vasicola pv. vasculorum NCPPB 1326]|uniref:Uncharacterized protein n=1 Tax=Xanthomonas vasicola pv. vasculorum NCPPB 890 TaxID=1184265 RepID=A0A836ZS22_XANVA|nr:hypothetical protein KW5_0104060 [Xanthomonas vasicola pv. vasculorum NCPPB 1326]KFA31355.1 hypothetical protein KWG_0110820 [Xanthomonas vasicola pv. vasculorum NCPPB 1381]
MYRGATYSSLFHLLTYFIGVEACDLLFGEIGLMSLRQRRSSASSSSMLIVTYSRIKNSMLKVSEKGSLMEGW